MNSIRIFGIGLVIGLFAAGFAQGKLQNITNGVRIDQHLNWQLPLDAQFRDETGRQTPLGDYFGGKKPVILALVYYRCPKLCGQVMNGLLQTLKVLPFDAGNQFDVMFISIDPTETSDLAAKKKQSYVQEYRRPGSENGWHFLTGDESEIKKVADATGFRYKYDPTTKLYVHGAAIMVITPKGKIAQYYYGIEFSERDLRLALVQSSEERIGSLVDTALLLCLDYDPIQGKYGFVIIPAMRIMAILVIGALAVFIIRSIKKDKRTPLTTGDEVEEDSR